MATNTRVVWTRKSLRLVNEIASYLAETNSPSFGNQFIQELFAFVDQSLIPHPERFPPCRFSKLRKADCRCFLYKKKYVVIYRFTESKDTIHIFGVIHSARNPKIFNDLLT